MPLLAKDVMGDARVYLNDVSLTYFTNTILLPYLLLAVNDLRGELFDNNIPYTNNVSAALLVNTGMFDIGGATGPALPEGLVEIEGVYERSAGSNEEFILITKVDFLPFVTNLSQSLINYAWQNQIIKFNGANSNREVKINFLQDKLANIIGEDSIIDMIRSRPFLAYRTAAIAADFGGEDAERADKLNQNAGRELDKLMNLSTKGRQAIATRRRPFQAGYRRGTINNQ